MTTETCVKTIKESNEVKQQKQTQKQENRNKLKFMKAKLVFQKQNFSKARSPLLNNLEVWQLQERLNFKLTLTFRKHKITLGIARSICETSIS